MASQHQTSTQYTPHLDGYLKGIRDEFDHLNHELHETRKQRDEFISKYKSLAEELRELRQTISSHTVTQHGQEAHTCRDADDNISLISSVSSSSAYNSCFDGEDAASDRLPNHENTKERKRSLTSKEKEVRSDNLGESDGPYQNEKIYVAPRTSSMPPQVDMSPANEPGDVESNSNSTAALNLNLMHKLTLENWDKIVAFSMDGKYLAVASGSGVLSIFDTRIWKRISVMKDLYHDEKSLPGYKCLEFSPDGKYLATGESDGNIRIWIISQRRVRNTFRHRNAVYALNFSPNGQCIVTCSNDETIMIWRLRDGFSSVLTASEFHPRSVRLSRDGQYIASGDYHGSMQLRDLRTGNLVASWGGHSDLVASLVFSPDGKRLLSGSWDSQVKQWDISFLRSHGIATRNPPISDMMEVSRFIGHTNWVASVSISPDGKWIASGSWDNTVGIWNAHEATLHHTLHCPSWVYSVDFSPVGNCVAIGGNSGDVTIWDYMNS